jgi:parallel beta-helix repeat protein
MWSAGRSWVPLGFAALCASVAPGCSDEATSPDAAVVADTGAPRDAAVAADTGATDAGAADLGTPDADTRDAAAADAEPVADSGEPADTGIPPNPWPRIRCEGAPNCIEFAAAQTRELLDAVNGLEEGATIILGAGTFVFDNALTIRGAAGVKLLGQGKDVTILNFAGQVAQANGVDVIGDRFTIEHLTITDSKKDGLRVEESTNVAIRAIKVTWSAGPMTSNGSYGIYPVRCTNVLMEDSEAYNASDAGLYVGQSINVIVRRNRAERNVAGLEIENTQYADVYDNDVTDNAAGLLVFDLPGNPVIGRDVYIHDNRIVRNNRANFAQSRTTVASIPRGTGTFALASRRVEIASNTYEGNLTTDIAILSCLAIRTATAWSQPLSAVRGSTVGLMLLVEGDRVSNFNTRDIYIHDNTHAATGNTPDGNDPEVRPLGALLALIYGLSLSGLPVDSILYDGIGEIVSPTVPSENTNLNRICVSNEPTATWATLDLPRLITIATMGGALAPRDLYRPAAPFAPFGCTGFSGPPIAPVVLPAF